MRHFRKVLLLVAVLFAAILSFSVYYYLNEQEVTAPTLEKVKILVAAKDIAPRMLITKDMVTQKEVLLDTFYDAFMTDASLIIGKYSKEIILEGEGFREERIISDLHDELSLKIEDHFRAISITVTHDSGVSDLIKTGDWVDILVTLPEIKEAERIVRPNITKLLLQNIEILAVDRVLHRAENYREENLPAYTLTLGIQVFDLEKIVLAQEIGSLKIALRPLDGDFIYPTEGTIWEELLLDDFNLMKDLFPQYDIKESEAVISQAVPIEKYVYYTVKYGDTLRNIALAFYGDESRYQLIKDVNKISDENIIVVGTALKIPILEQKDGEGNE